MGTAAGSVGINSRSQARTRLRDLAQLNMERVLRTCRAIAEEVVAPAALPVVAIPRTHTEQSESRELFPARQNFDAIWKQIDFLDLPVGQQGFHRTR